MFYFVCSFLFRIPLPYSQKKPFIMWLIYVLKHRCILVKDVVFFVCFNSIKGFVNPALFRDQSMSHIWFIAPYCCMSFHSVIYYILFIHYSKDGYTSWFQLPVAIYAILVWIFARFAQNLLPYFLIYFFHRALNNFFNYGYTNV